MLDKEHARPRRNRGESTLYILGELSGHNVVLAGLPGSQGNGAAAAIAKDMARTFPSIELRLMVGIGGGVPSKMNDIRLGDVVISMPDGQHGGVVQYDLGKNTEDGFIMKGFLWPPPEILRSAVGIMQSDHRISKSKIPEFLSAMFRKSDDLRIFYQRPPAESDELFESGFRHIPNQVTCAQCDKTKVVQRAPREPIPKIHYGLIASGDQVMRSATNAAEINGRFLGDILCFEMEAAGIMTEYSCIAIRGISDYADSHKNDAWQHYAAAAAAGCAKELLSYVDPPEPSIMTPVTLHEPGGSTDLSCLANLRTTDPRHDKERIEETKGGLLKESYRWILDNAHFRRWRDEGQSRLLWIKGDPGKGKTMLLCGIVNELKKSMAKTDLLSYFFCQATDSRINNATAVLRGLVYLLVNQQPSLISHIRKKHDHAGKTLFEDTNAWVALSEIFTSILQDLSLNSTYLIIDALDECVADLPRLLKLIAQQSSASHAKWIVSSRYNPDIERTLRLDGSRASLSLELKENAKKVSDAVDAFIDHCVSDLALINQYDQYDKNLQEKVRNKLRGKANGTFLWVSLVTKELQNVMSCDVLQVIDEVPSELTGVYQRMVQQIQGLPRRDQERCRLVLSTATAAYRPLRLEELGILSGLPREVATKKEIVEQLVNMCGSFLTIIDENVYIIHQSANDFLVTDAFIFPSGRRDVHHTMFSASIQILSKTLRRDIYGLGTPGFPIDRIEQPEPDPLAAARYACVYWVDHLRDSSGNARQDDDLRDGGAVDNFVRKKYLYWLEALSLCNRMSEGVLSMAKLEDLTQVIFEPVRLFNFYGSC